MSRRLAFDFGANPPRQEPEQLGLFATPKPAPVAPAAPVVERDLGGEYTLDTSIPCVVCGKATTVRVSHPDGERTADPRGVCGERARVVYHPAEYGFDVGTDAHACWDCSQEHGREGEQRVLDRAARVHGWRKLATSKPLAPWEAPAVGVPRTQLGDDVLRVLSACEIVGANVRLPGSRLDRKLYVRVNEALEALGGKWSKKAKAHVFADDPSDALDAAISTGYVVRAKDLGWYPTPEPLACEIVARLGSVKGAKALEPSAGEGAIARALRDAGALVQCHEIDPGRVDKLRADGFNVYHGDFLTWPVSRVYQCVAMNPPFGKRADVAHVNHALRFLQSGGKLVAIMSAGVMFREDRLATEFRAAVKACGGAIEALPDGSFTESGTGVRTCVVTMEAA